MILFAIGVSIIALLVFMYFELKEKYLLALFFKGFASFGFIFVFGFAVIEHLSGWPVQSLIFDLYIQRVVMLFLFGFVFGLLGDVFLALRPLMDPSRDKKIIVGGITYFALGHIFYLIALSLLSTFSYLSLVLGFVMALIVFFGSKILKFEMGIAKYPSILYTFLIFMLVGQAIAYGIESQFSSLSAFILFGALLFSFSDLLLAPIYFQGNKSKFLIGLNLGTYYLAQIFLACSMLFVSSSGFF